MFFIADIRGTAAFDHLRPFPGYGKATGGAIRPEWFGFHLPPFCRVREGGRKNKDGS